jgi:hypothetical protein
MVLFGKLTPQGKILIITSCRVVILLSSGIYVRAGREIYAKRKQLRNFRISPPDPLPILGDPFQSIKTTEVYVTSESAESRRDSFGSIDQEYRRPEPARQQHYTVTVSTAQQSPRNQPRYSYAEKPMPPQREGNCSIPISAYGPNSGRGNLYPTRRYAAMAANNAAWSYTKVACLFFVAMMITWIPSSANRVFSVLAGILECIDLHHYQLACMSAGMDSIEGTEEMGWRRSPGDGGGIPPRR